RGVHRDRDRAAADDASRTSGAAAAVRPPDRASRRLEPDHQGTQAALMLTRVRNVLARLRSVDAPAAVAATPEPWPSFDDEVAASGGTTCEWVGRRRACRSLYTDI